MSDENKKTVEEPDFEKLARTTAPSRFNKVVTIILVAICVVLAAFIIFRMTSSSDSSQLAMPVAENTSSAVNVSVQSAEIKDFSRISKLNGEIRRSGDSLAVYPDITSSGTVTEILVSRGDTVKAGDTVAYIDPSRPGAVYKISPVVSKADEQRFLAAAAEHIRVAAFEANHQAARADATGLLDKDLVDAMLRNGMAPLPLANVNTTGAHRKLHELGRYEPVIHHSVGSAEKLPPPHRNKPRVSGAGTHERHESAAAPCFSGSLPGRACASRLVHELSLVFLAFGCA